jgi:hypothetical protein
MGVVQEFIQSSNDRNRKEDNAWLKISGKVRDISAKMADAQSRNGMLVFVKTPFFNMNDTEAYLREYITDVLYDRVMSSVPENKMRDKDYVSQVMTNVAPQAFIDLQKALGHFGSESKSLTMTALDRGLVQTDSDLNKLALAVVGGAMRTSFIFKHVNFVSRDLYKEKAIDVGKILSDAFKSKSIDKSSATIAGTFAVVTLAALYDVLTHMNRSLPRLRGLATINPAEPYANRAKNLLTVTRLGLTYFGIPGNVSDSEVNEVIEDNARYALGILGGNNFIHDGRQAVADWNQLAKNVAMNMTSVGFIAGTGYHGIKSILNGIGYEFSDAKDYNEARKMYFDSNRKMREALGSMGNNDIVWNINKMASLIAFAKEAKQSDSEIFEAVYPDFKNGFWDSVITSTVGLTLSRAPEYYEPKKRSDWQMVRELKLAKSRLDSASYNKLLSKIKYYSGVKN